MKYRPAQRVPAPPPGTYELAGALIDLAIEYIGESARTRDLAKARSVRRSGQQIRLVAVLITNGTYDHEVGRSWLDAGRISLALIQRGVTV